MRSLLLSTLFISLLLAGCQHNTPSDQKTTEIFVSAAASLSDAMDEIKQEYESAHPDVNLTFNFGGSGKLAQQIQQGANVDVFLSANQDWMDVLADEKMIVADTRSDFVKNKLVMIGKKNADLNWTTFKDIDASVGQIAIGNPDSVPAGNYAKEVLTHLDKWDALKDKFVYAKDVTQVLSYVESGNTAIGFVYQSDVLRSNSVEVLAEANKNWYTPIVYPAAVTSSSENRDEADDFISFLTSDEGQAILADYGFAK
ncbi:molybdate ABC transporter substrate-binding protein [Lentibacillus sp. N15]|uniref:molybdate ABC transporter substrate-binding protein n=1 Tax=Lentibacillus songyuanensis TaxID=3136161 RepID=UPI0031BAED5A